MALVQWRSDFIDFFYRPVDILKVRANAVKSGCSRLG